MITLSTTTTGDIERVIASAAQAEIGFQNMSSPIPQDGVSVTDGAVTHAGMKYGDAFFKLKHKSYYRGSSSPTIDFLRYNYFFQKTSLVSATVSLFVVESYERLSPDPGEQTVFLLNKLSQQLAGIAKGALIDSLPPSDPKFIFYPRLSYVSIL
ncbi:hypothetical protein EDB85DRAFT_2277041 [Lactarius pseudohatsudake]|nr:hypothetical protein EDB85DRAFT_2277041 [Lactarius pseudohatsudake]